MRPFLSFKRQTHLLEWTVKTGQKLIACACCLNSYLFGQLKNLYISGPLPVKLPVKKIFENFYIGPKEPPSNFRGTLGGRFIFFLYFSLLEMAGLFKPYRFLFWKVLFLKILNWTGFQKRRTKFWYSPKLLFRRRRKAKTISRQAIACTVAQKCPADLPIIEKDPKEAVD